MVFVNINKCTNPNLKFMLNSKKVLHSVTMYYFWRLYMQ